MRFNGMKINLKGNTLEIKGGEILLLEIEKNW